MIDFLPFIKALPIYGIMLMVPGPDFMMVSSLSLSRGRFAGLQGAAGISTGFLFYTALSLWGLGYIFERMLWLNLAIKILGGLYLCYLGLLLWRASFQQQVLAVPDVETVSVKGKNAYIMGLLTNFTNPKVTVFFASVFALALTSDTNVATKTVTSLLCAMTAMAWFGFVAIVLSVPRLRTHYQRWSRVIDRLAGSIFVLFGLKLVFSGKS
jgi:threonine efflux protein